MELMEFKIDCYTIQEKFPKTQNKCILCGKTKFIAGTVSFFLKGHLGTHILIFLCEKHWNDVGILEGISKALKKIAIDIKNGPTWNEILSRKTGQSG